MEIIIVLIGAILLFFFGGLFGWVVKFVSMIVSFLMDGCWSSMGCISWIIIGFLILLVLAL